MLSTLHIGGIRTRFYAIGVVILHLSTLYAGGIRTQWPILNFAPRGKLVPGGEICPRGLRLSSGAERRGEHLSPRGQGWS
jgi:hypothetical protein